MRHSPIGAHARVAGGLAKGGLAHADAVDAEVVQVFVSNPRGWATASGDDRQDAAFRDGCAERGLVAYVHAPYLVNLGSPTPATLTRSVTALRHSLRRGREIGARGVVFHAGSAVAGARYEDAMRQVREQLLPLLDSLDEDDPRLLVEPTAGGGQALAATVQGLGAYVDALDRHPRLAVCLDTCHAFAAGHDIGTAEGMTAMLDELVAAVGADRLALVHANDSKDACGSRRDRHANIGDGEIGAAPFGALLRHPAARAVPLLVETPGGGAQHARDVATLKALRDG